MEKIKLVIPARYASSRLPGKALLPINGKPMCWHVVQRCLESGFCFDDIFVATDSINISDALEEFGINVVMTSEYHKSGTDRIYEVTQHFGWSADTLVVNIQGDEPLLQPELINSLVDFSFGVDSYDIYTVVSPIRSIKDFIDTNVVKAILGEHGRTLYFTRSASPLNRNDKNDLLHAYQHVGVYSYTVEALRKFCRYDETSLEKYEKLEQLRALSNGMTIGAYLFDGDVFGGVDTLSDYEKVKQIMEKSDAYLKNRSL